MLATSVPECSHPVPHLHRGLGSPLPHLHAAATSARGTGLAAATSARGAGLSSQSKVLDTPPRTLAHPPHILHTPDRRRLPAPDKPANHYSLVWGSKFKRRLARQHRNDGSGCRGYSFACCCSSSTLREAWRGSRTALRANCPAASQIGPKAKVESDVAAEIGFAGVLCSAWRLSFARRMKGSQEDPLREESEKVPFGSLARKPNAM